MYRSILYIICCIVLCTTATSQKKDVFPLNGNYFSKHFGLTQGLPDQGILKIVKDKYGLLWLGGWHGLYVYDGQKFTAFTATEGLPGDIVTDIKIDGQGIIYVATYSGFCRYTGAYPLAFNNYTLPASLGITNISAIYPIDSTHIYFADERNRKLYFLNGHTVSVVKGFDGIAMDMQQDKAGTLFIMAAEYLIYAVKDCAVTAVVSEPLYEAPVGQPKLNHQLEKDSFGNVFYNGKTLWLLQNTKSILAPYTIAEKKAPHYNYTARPPAKAMLYEIKDTGLLPLFALPGVTTINSSFVKTSPDIFWFAIDGAGLNCYYPKLFKPVQQPKMMAYYITDAAGRRVIRNDSFLYQNPVIRNFCTKLTDPLNNIYLARDGTVWFCCSTTGVHYLKKGSKVIQHYKNAVNENVFVNAIEDHDGTLWLETFNGMVSYKNGTFKNWGLADGLTERAFYSAANDKNGIYYAGSSNNIYAWYKGVPRIITTQLGLQHGYYRLAADNEVNVWLCANNNMLVKMGSDGKGNFYKQDSLPVAINGKKFIPGSIAFDNNDNLWVAGYGLLIIYRKQPNGKYIDSDKLVIADDQHLDEFTAKKATVSADESGNTIFLNNVCFNAAAVIERFNNVAPLVSLRQVRLFQQQQNWAALHQKIDHYGIPVNPVLNSKQNAWSFYFAGITTTEQEDVVYQYKLDNYDTDWGQITTATKVDYTNLPPGEYTFFVRAANINGRWSKPVVFRFTILPPWYHTWWANLFWLFLIISLVSLFFVIRLKGVKRREWLKRIVIEQQLKALRAQITPHFLQNSFVFLSQSLTEKPLEQTISVMAQLSSYLRHVLDLSDEGIIKLEEEIEFAGEYLAINRMLFNDTFTYTITVAPEVDVFGIIVPSMLLQPILENAIKYGVRYRPVNVAIIAVYIYCDEEFAYFNVSNTIVDPPPGKPRNYKPKGLIITEQRLKLLYKSKKMQPSISISNLSDQYQVTIRIPL